MKTIVQEYGPIYGEPVNGTVMGRPNGSVFVPSTNVVKLILDEDYRYLTYWSDRLIVCDSSGSYSAAPVYEAVAEAQDLASKITVYGYSDPDLEAEHQIGLWTGAGAGNFNVNRRYLYYPDTTLTDGQTLYLVAYLENNGTRVAVSDVIEVTMVVPA